MFISSSYWKEICDCGNPYSGHACYMDSLLQTHISCMFIKTSELINYEKQNVALVKRLIVGTSNAVNFRWKTIDNSRYLEKFSQWN